MKTAYTLKKPNVKGRKTFAVIKDVVNEAGKRSQKTVIDPRIESVNLLVSKGLRDLTTAEIELRAVIDALYEEDRKLRGVGTYTEHNQKLVQAYWEAEYVGRDLVDPASARQRLDRAVAAVSLLSLSSASRNELEAALNASCGDDPNKQRRNAAALNQILSFLKRTERIRLMKEVKEDVKYLTQEEVERLAKNSDDSDEALLYRVLFATGARLGEAVAMKYVGGKSVHIKTQLDRKGVHKETKTRTSRHAYILPDYAEAVLEWAALPLKIKAKFQKLHVTYQRRMKRRCKLFKDPAKECTLHDLRHSYAIHLIQLGASLELVSQSLGNSVTVCERYYSGFQLRPEGIEMLDKTVRRK